MGIWLPKDRIWIAYVDRYLITGSEEGRIIVNVYGYEPSEEDVRKCAKSMSVYPRDINVEPYRVEGRE